MVNQTGQTGGRTPRRHSKLRLIKLMASLILMTLLSSFFLYARAEAKASEAASANGDAHRKLTQADSSTRDSTSNDHSDTAQGTTTKDTTSGNVSMQSLEASELRQISGKEGLTFDTHTFDRTVEKDEVLGEDGNNANDATVTFAPVDVDMTVGQFTVDLDTENELIGGTQLDTIESEIPSLDGHFSVGIIMPGSTKSMGNFGMGIQYPGGGRITATRN